MLAAAAALALAGCAIAEREGAPAPVRALFAERSSAQELVAFLGEMRGRSDAALAAEARRQARGASDVARVKAAIALSLSTQPDEAEVIALTEPLARKRAGDEAARAMASFLHAMALDRRRLRESAAAAAARAQEERRALEAQRTRAEAAQERMRELQQKLDALTALEKSLSDRQPQTR